MIESHYLYWHYPRRHGHFFGLDSADVTSEIDIFVPLISVRRV